MKSTHWLGTALGAGVFAWFLLHHGASSDAALAPAPAIPAPPVVLLEGPADGTFTDIVVRTPGVQDRPRVLGRVTHAANTARRAAVVSRDGHTTALLVVAEREGRGASTYDSALFRVEGGAATRLVGELTNASAPLVTERGTVLVQRGQDGPEPVLDENNRTLRERTDALSLEAVDPVAGTVRTVWSGRGQIAFLATPLRGDDALVFHIDDAGGHLLVLDAATGATRTLEAQMLPLARDFSYNAARDELVFVRAAAYGSEQYEVVKRPVYGSDALRVVYRGESDHLMPRVLSDGAIAVSLPGGSGLGLLESGAVRTLAPLGAGADAVLAESPDRRWVFFRHTTQEREVLGLMGRANGVVSQTIGRADVLVEFAGFAGEVVR